MLSIIKHKPHARVLVITPTQLRAGDAASWLRAQGCTVAVLGEDRPQEFQFICSTLALARRNLRYLGYIDQLVLDDCANMSPIEGTRKYDEILTDLQMRNKSMQVLAFKTQAVLNLPSVVKQTWRCDPDTLPHIPDGVTVSHGSFYGCGESNDLEHYFCRYCSRFRGFPK